MSIRGSQQGEVLEMHVGVSRQKTEQGYLEETNQIQARRIGVKSYGLADLLHGAIVFLLGCLVQDLTEILQMKFLILESVHSPCDVGQYS